MERFVTVDEFSSGWNLVRRCAQNRKILRQRESHVVCGGGEALRLGGRGGPLIKGQVCPEETQSLKTIFDGYPFGGHVRTTYCRIGCCRHYSHIYQFRLGGLIINITLIGMIIVTSWTFLCTLSWSFSWSMSLLLNK